MDVTRENTPRLMIHHEHDPELIMAIAEGADVSDAERTAIAECPDCAADLAAQLVALTALRAAPAVAVTELESMRLLRHVDAELAHVRRPAEVRTPQARRRFSWAPAFSIAAVILALVLVAPALNLLGGGNDEAGDFNVALSPTTTTVAASRGAVELAPTARLQEAVPETGAADAPVPPTTLAPFSDDDAATAADGGADLDSPPTLTDLRSIIEDAGRDPEMSRERVAEIYDLTEPAPLDDPDTCVEQGVAEVGDTTASFTLGSLIVSPEPFADDDMGELGYVTVTVHELTNEDLALVAHDPVTCRNVATSP
jgi:hypothetical protein